MGQGVTSQQREQLFRQILKGVSRSFYLTLRVLPSGVREPIAVAYLLARAADTLADTRVLPAAQRLNYLHCFQGYLQSPESTVGCEELLHALQGELDNPDELRLLQLLPQLFVLYASLQANDRRQVSQVVTTLTSGMLFDLQTFPSEESGEVVALQRPEELDRYTYLVAGCVGEFWTAISQSHVAALNDWDRQLYSELGIEFGKALQYTNILRDLPRDLRIGRCYLPQAWLDEYGLDVQQLINGGDRDKAQLLLTQGARQALLHFAAAEQYLLAIPRSCVRLRLAALWPLLIGLATLQRLLEAPNWLDVDTTIKVDRQWVYRMLWQSLWRVGSDRLLKNWIASLRPRLMSIGC